MQTSIHKNIIYRARLKDTFEHFTVTSNGINSNITENVIVRIKVLHKIKIKYYPITSTVFLYLSNVCSC